MTTIGSSSLSHGRLMEGDFYAIQTDDGEETIAQFRGFKEDSSCIFLTTHEDPPKSVFVSIDSVHPLDSAEHIKVTEQSTDRVLEQIGFRRICQPRDGNCRN
jgi:hypothetical protein